MLRVVQSWNRLFTPTEATSIVASTIMNSQSTVISGYKHGCMDCCSSQTNYYFHQSHQQAVDFTKQDNLIASVRALALQCAHEVRYLYLYINNISDFLLFYILMITADLHKQTNFMFSGSI